MRIGKYLSFSFSIQNDLKQGHVLSPLLFNCGVEYTIKNVEETNLGLDMKVIQQILDYDLAKFAYRISLIHNSLAE